MGCWDIFCFLCGNTCRVQDLIEEINKNNKNLNNYKNFKKETKWLKKCTFLTADNKIIHGCHEYACNTGFVDKKNNKYIHSTTYINENEMYGVFTHTDCWKFIKSEYNIKLTYSHLPIFDVKITDTKIFKFINYGSIEKYWDQYFNFIQVFTTNLDLCKSPLKCSLLAKNIKKVFSKLKIRTDENRKSPIVSATFYKPNTYKIGINGNIWVTKSNKWIELKNTIIKDNYKINKHVIYSGDINNKPIFIIKNKLKTIL